MIATRTPLRSAPAMTRCECQQKSFAEAVEFAQSTGIHDFDEIRDCVGIGQVCAACHCDLKCRLAAELPRRER